MRTLSDSLRSTDRAILALRIYPYRAHANKATSLGGSWRAGLGGSGRKSGSASASITPAISSTPNSVSASATPPEHPSSAPTSPAPVAGATHVRRSSAPIGAETVARAALATETEQADELCTICLSELQTGELVRGLPRCVHVYHAACIAEWIRRQHGKIVCPCCMRQTESTLRPQPWVERAAVVVASAWLRARRRLRRALFGRRTATSRALPTTIIARSLTRG
jgi:hypothetical protein